MFIGERSSASTSKESIENYFADFEFNVSGIDFSHLDDDDAENVKIDSEPTIDSESEIELQNGENRVYATEMLETEAFSLVHKFFQAQGTIGELEKIDNDSIVEDEGVFIIPKDLEIKNENVNKDFKTLVDSVLK